VEYTGCFCLELSGSWFALESLQRNPLKDAEEGLFDRPYEVVAADVLGAFLDLMEPLKSAIYFTTPNFCGC
jgi:hypothetical protein